MEVVFEAESTFNGMCYKNEEAFNSGVGVCYIPECVFNTFPFGEYTNACWEIRIDEKDIQKHIYNGAFETKETIIQSAKSILESYGMDDAAQCTPFVEQIAHDAFCIVDWQCIETYILEIDMEEEWNIFPQEQWNKFLQFCKGCFMDDKGESLAIENEEEFEERIKSFVGNRYLNEPFDALFEDWNGYNGFKYEDADIYEIVTEGNGKKQIKIHGYCYFNDECWQMVNPSFCYLSVDEIVNCKNDDDKFEVFNTAIDGSKQYQGDVSFSEVIDFYKGINELRIEKVSSDTPDGLYVNY